MLRPLDGRNLGETLAPRYRPRRRAPLGDPAQWLTVGPRRRACPRGRPPWTAGPPPLRLPRPQPRASVLAWRADRRAVARAAARGRRLLAQRRALQAAAGARR